MKILITGANGYIGSRLVEICLDKGFDVIAVDINNNYIDNRATYINFDIFSNSNLFESNDLSSVNVLIHLAWRNGFVHNDVSHIQDLPKHITFLKQAIDKGIKYISVMGSMHEVGYYEGAISENTPCNPMSLYGISKNALRQIVQLLANEHNFYLHWLRAYYIIGNDLRSNSIFGKIVRKSLEGATEFPMNSGKNKYDFISLDQLCEQIVATSVQNEVNGIINVCSGRPVSLGEQVEKFIKEKKIKMTLNYGAFPDRPYDSPCVYGDAKKISKIMNNSLT